MPDLSTRLSYSYLGWLSTKKEEKQEIVKQMLNLEKDSEFVQSEMEKIDLENLDEMNRMFEKIIYTEQKAMNSESEEDRVEKDSGIIISIEDFEDEKNESLERLETQDDNIENEATDDNEESEEIHDDKIGDGEDNLEEETKDNTGMEEIQDNHMEHNEERNEIISDSEEDQVEQETGITIRIQNFEEETNESVKHMENQDFIYEKSEEILDNNIGEDPEEDTGLVEIQRNKNVDLENERDESARNVESLKDVLKSLSIGENNCDVKRKSLEITLSEATEDVSAEENLKESSRRRSLVVLGQRSRPNSLIALEEALTEAGEAIKNMDESEKEALDEVTFNDTQVEAIKFLANVASKK